MRWSRKLLMQDARKKQWLHRNKMVCDYYSVAVYIDFIGPASSVIYSEIGNHVKGVFSLFFFIQITHLRKADARLSTIERNSMSGVSKTA